MKYSLYFFSLLFLGTVLVSCESDDDELTRSLPMADHAQMMGFQGKVHHVKVSVPEEDLISLNAAFDAFGRCLRWNDTGVDDGEPASSYGLSSGWLSSPASYSYTYNDKGQLIAVEKAALGAEVEHYTLRYGQHNLSIPLPFPIGLLAHYPVQGIAEIQSENYHLVCDGMQAVAEQRALAWMSLRTHTEYVFSGNRVVETTERLYGGRPGEEEQQLERVRTFYEYQGDGLSRVLAVRVDADEHQEKFETLFDIHRPLRPICKRLYSGLSAVPLYEMEYTYDKANRLKNVRNTVGEPYIEEACSYDYGGFDAVGNWTKSTKTTEAGEVTLLQNVSYWN